MSACTDPSVGDGDDIRINRDKLVLCSGQVRAMFGSELVSEINCCDPAPFLETRPLLSTATV